MKVPWMLMLAGATAQLLSAQETTPPYRTGTRVVEITIAASQAEKPVTDLQAKDLQLFDNDKEQTIASFEKPGAGAPVTTGTGSRRLQRLSIVVLDALNTSWSDQMYAGEGVQRMLSKLPPGDRVAIFALDDRLHLLHDFSTDYASLSSAVKEYESEPSSDFEAWRVYPVYPVEVAKSFVTRPSPADPYQPGAFSSYPAVFDNGTLADFYKTNRIGYTLQALSLNSEIERCWSS